MTDEPARTLGEPAPPLDLGALAELEEDLGTAFGPFVQGFFASAPRDLDAGAAALDAGDGVAAANLAHRLKGTAGYLGAVALADCLGRLQHAAHGGDLTLARALSARARGLLAELEALLRARAGHD